MPDASDEMWERFVYGLRADQPFEADRCFLCGVVLTLANRTDEHVFPQWLLREFDLSNAELTFTGCEDAVRDELERRVERLGVRVMNNVSSRTVLLVTDGSFSGGKAADAAALGYPVRAARRVRVPA